MPKIPHAFYQFRFGSRQLGILLVTLLGVLALTFVLGYLVGRSSRQEPDWVAKVARERAAERSLPKGRTAAPEKDARKVSAPVGKRAQGLVIKDLVPPKERVSSRPAARKTVSRRAVRKSKARRLAQKASQRGLVSRKRERGHVESNTVALSPSLKAKSLPTSPAPSGRKGAQASTARYSREGRYFIQVGSFLSRETALRQQKALRRKAYPAFIREVDLGPKGKWHRVLVGRYPTREKALEEANRLAKTVKVKPRVLREEGPGAP